MSKKCSLYLNITRSELKFVIYPCQVVKDNYKPTGARKALQSGMFPSPLTNKVTI